MNPALQAGGWPVTLPTSHNHQHRASKICPFLLQSHSSALYWETLTCLPKGKCHWRNFLFSELVLKFGCEAQRQSIHNWHLWVWRNSSLLYVHCHSPVTELSAPIPLTKTGSLSQAPPGRSLGTVSLCVLAHDKSLVLSFLFFKKSQENPGWLVESMLEVW